MKDYSGDLMAWMQSIQNEIRDNNARSTIIVCSSILEEQLERLIKNVLVNDKRIDSLVFEGQSAPISTFSAKITMSYFMGLISEQEYKLLSTIRKIRNKAAHEIDIQQSKSSSIHDLCMNLEIPKGMYVPPEVFFGDLNAVDMSYEPNQEKETLARFVNVFYYLTECLYLRTIDYIDVEKNPYVSEEPHVYLERFRDILVRDNSNILIHLRKCVKKAEEDIGMLIEKLKEFQAGDSFDYRGETLNSKEIIKEVIGIVTDEKNVFEEEARIRESGDISISPDSNYANICRSIESLNEIIEVVKKTAK